MDDLQKTLERIGGHLHDLDAGQKLTTEQIKLLLARSESQETTIRELRSDFAGLADAVIKLYTEHQKHEKKFEAMEARLAALEAKAS